SVPEKTLVSCAKLKQEKSQTSIYQELWPSFKQSRNYKLCNYLYMMGSLSIWGCWATIVFNLLASDTISAFFTTGVVVPALIIATVYISQSFLDKVLDTHNEILHVASLNAPLDPENLKRFQSLLDNAMLDTRFSLLPSKTQNAIV